MLLLEVVAVCLLFGTLTHSQPECLSKCSFFYTVSADKHGPIANLPFSLNVCSCLCPPERSECPLDVYFTIDTSETIALQEPPPGSLVESIKVPSVFTIFKLENPQHKILQFHVIVFRCLLTMLFHVSGVAVGVHQEVCGAFK